MYIIEANPRASRTVPFVAKAIGHPVAKYASLLMAGLTLAEIGFTEEPPLGHVAVKEAVLPFDKFPGARNTKLMGSQDFHCMEKRLLQHTLSRYAGSEWNEGQVHVSAQVATFIRVCRC